MHRESIQGKQVRLMSEFIKETDNYFSDNIIRFVSKGAIDVTIMTCMITAIEKILYNVLKNTNECKDKDEKELYMKQLQLTFDRELESLGYEKVKFVKIKD